MTNADDPENASAPQGPVVASASASSSSADSGPVEICAVCHLPLLRRGPKGECFRCLADFAFAPDDGAFSNASPGVPSPGNNPLRYGHFEIATGADGHPVELGAGAMATTYRARDSVLHSAVALKVINQKVAEHPGARARFLREARAAAKLHHPNVASVSHYGEQNGECYYVMELVEGETLEERVRREGPLPPALVLEIGVQVARALAAAEACGVMHRDLKPSNIMLTTHQGERIGDVSATVKVIDWGLAKALSAESVLGADHTQGAFVGTPAFASPEQFLPMENRRIDTRADIYSLGVTLWYLLSGRTPFMGSTLEDIHSRQLQNTLPLEQLSTARVPGRVIALLKSMLAVDPAARPQSARELIESLRGCQEQFPFETVPRHARRRWFHRTVVVMGLLVLAACAVAGWKWVRRPPSTPADRSIAVLPFENLSPDEVDAFFTVGVQDEITADLARIASLKVIGSNSTRSYAVGRRDLARIGRELGVRHLLEGSVRREGGQVRVTVRLADVHDPAHPWTNQYARRLSDVFAVQGEITRAVADRLNVVLSEGQKAAIDEPPTSDLAAYDLYLRARELPRATTNTAGKEIFANAGRAVHWLDEAIARDPKFSLAYCELARRHDELYFYRGIGPPEELLVDHRSLAEMALSKATRLRPDSGALHLSLAIHALQVTHDPEQAEIEVQLARRSLPNNAQVEVIAGRVARRQDRWDEAVRCLERAVSLEPRDTELRTVLANTYRYLRRYDDVDRMLASIIALTPSGEVKALPLDRAWAQAEHTADLTPAREMFSTMVAAGQIDDETRLLMGTDLALWTRDSAFLAQVLSDPKWVQLEKSGAAYSREWYEALSARMRGDQEGAAKAFAVAREKIEKKLFSDSYQSRPLSLLAIVDAGMGRKEQAVAEAKQACELTPFSTMNLEAPTTRCNLAIVYAWTGRNDLAFAELDKLIDRPAGNNSMFQPTYGDLRLNPLWDPLRGDPRFEALARRLAPPLSVDVRVKQ